MPKIGAIILAAGESTRLGQPKQLLHVGGKSLVRHMVDETIQADCTPVVVVTGNEHEKVSAELQSADVVLVENKNWKRGIGTSIRTGVDAVIRARSNIDAIVLLVCDQPFVGSGVIRKLIELRDKTGKPIMASSYAGTLGVPALFDRVCFPELLKLPNDSGAKPIILAQPDRVAQLPFPDGARDIDTLVDYDAVRR